MKSAARLACLVTVWVSIVASAQVRFTAAEYSSSDQYTASIANGDFDGDGILDLVTVNYDTLSFYKGLGGGKFASPVNQKLATTNLGQVAAADFNGDGKLDLAITSGGSGNNVVTILLGNGNGSFKQGVNIPVGGTAAYIALADFNGDHIPDIAISLYTSSTGMTKVYLGRGNGIFHESSELSYGGRWIVTGDFNADGHQDIAVLGNNELGMYLGDGDGKFQSPLLAGMNNPAALAVGDFYNNRIQSLAVITAVPNGTFFDNYISTARYLNGELVVSSQQFIANNFSFFEVAGGDLNGDFTDDVVLTGGTKFGSGALTYIMFGNGDGTFQTKVSLPAYGQAEPFPFIRDLNLDSRHDIGTAWTNGYIVNGGGAWVLLNTNARTNCAPPKANALGVHLCAPYSGQNVGSTFTFRAAGNAFNGVAKRMELWVDGNKLGQNLEDQLNVTATLPVGKHVASFVAVDSFDNHVVQSVTFHVQ